MNNNTNIKKIILSKIKKIKHYSIQNDLSVSEQIDNIAGILNQNCDMLILSGYTAQSDMFLNIAKQTRQLCSIFNVTFIIEDRCDIAKIVDSDGIFLSKNSYSVEDCLIITDKDKLIGTYNSDNLLKSQYDFILSQDKILTE